MTQFDWIEYGPAAFAFQSQYNLWLLDRSNYTTMCGIMFFLGSGETLEGHRNWQKSQTWRIAEIRGWSEICYFQGGQGGLPYEEEVRQISF